MQAMDERREIFNDVRMMLIYEDVIVLEEHNGLNFCSLGQHGATTNSIGV